MAKKQKKQDSGQVELKSENKSSTKKQLAIQETWEAKIQRSKSVRNKWKENFNVDLGYEYYEGRQKDSTYSDADWITINNIYSHVKAQLPALYSSDPYFYVKLRRSFDPDPAMIAAWDQRGKIRGGYLNYLKESLKLKAKMRLSIQDAFFKYGVIKTHYHSESAENPDYGKPIFAKDGKTKLKDNQGADLQEPEFIPVHCRYKLTRLLPDDVLFDEDASSLEDSWKWVACRVRETLGEAENNKNFSKKALKELQGKGGTSDPEVKERDERKKGNNISGRAEMQPEKKGEPRKKSDLISFWEIYNLENLTWLIIAEDGTIPMMDESPLPPGIVKHPLSFLRFTLREDSPYPIPSVSQGLDPAKEYNRARSDIQKHRKRFNRKYEVNLAIAGNDDSELSKLESGDDGTIIKVNQTGGIQPIKDAPGDQTRYTELGFLKSEMVEMLGGTAEAARGIAGSDSATEAGILNSRLNLKEGDAMSMVVDFVTDIAEKLDRLVQTHIDRDEAVKITGPQGEFWEIVKVEDYDEIAGEYQYSVNVGSTIPQLPQMERASWQAFLGLLSKFPQLMLSKRLLKSTAEQHHIEDEALIDELYDIGQKMMGGQIPTPGGGGGGSQAGVSEDRPESAMGGQAGGGQSLVTGNAAIAG